MYLRITGQDTLDAPSVMSLPVDDTTLDAQLQVAGAAAPLNRRPLPLPSLTFAMWAYRVL